jgi:hypothetical protein
MNTGFEDSLKGLKLEDGIEGVQKLMPQKRLVNEFMAVSDDHLHVAVECPMTGEFQKLIVIAAFLIQFPAFLVPCPSHHPSRSSHFVFSPSSNLSPPSSYDPSFYDTAHIGYPVPASRPWMLPSLLRSGDVPTTIKRPSSAGAYDNDDKNKKQRTGERSHLMIPVYG